jgi:hypothetical protein
MAAAPDTTNWALLGAQLALSITVPRELSCLLSGVTDRATFWEAAVRAIVHIEHPADLAVVNSILQPAASASGSQPWVTALLADVPGATAATQAPAPHPAQPAPSPSLTHVIVRFNVDDIAAVCATLRRHFHHDLGLRHSMTAARSFHFGSVPTAKHLWQGVTRGTSFYPHIPWFFSIYPFHIAASTSARL